MATPWSVSDDDDQILSLAEAVGVLGIDFEELLDILVDQGDFDVEFPDGPDDPVFYPSGEALASGALRYLG